MSTNGTFKISKVRVGFPGVLYINRTNDECKKNRIRKQEYYANGLPLPDDNDKCVKVSCNLNFHYILDKYARYLPLFNRKNGQWMKVVFLHYAADKDYFVSEYILYQKDIAARFFYDLNGSYSYKKNSVFLSRKNTLVGTITTTCMCIQKTLYFTFDEVNTYACYLLNSFDIHKGRVFTDCIHNSRKSYNGHFLPAYKKNRLLQFQSYNYK